MEGQNGMEICPEAAGRKTSASASLFITGSSQYPKDGYSVRPIQYLFKPVQREELEDALRTDLRRHHRPRTLTLRTGNKTTVLPIPGYPLFGEPEPLGCGPHEGGPADLPQQPVGSGAAAAPNHFCRQPQQLSGEHGLGGADRPESCFCRMAPQVSVSRGGYYESMQRQFVRFLNLK